MVPNPERVRVGTRDFSVSIPGYFRGIRGCFEGVTVWPNMIIVFCCKILKYGKTG